MDKIIKDIAKKFPAVKELIDENDKLSSELSVLKKSSFFVPPGHFSSPIPSKDDIRKHEERTSRRVPREIPGVDLRKENQIALLKMFKPYYDEMPFPSQKVEDLRYFFENPAYSYSDAIFLYCMIRHLKPKRIIEVGSGYSSCVILDTNELFFNDKIQTTFIEPHSELLLSLIREQDKNIIRLISSNLQDVSLNEFSTLQENDILFIDSTHVAKVSSDVNYIFFEILPYLHQGVYIHFHDVFYPFEYPVEWVCENRAWNEAYLLRTFLQYNSTFEIVLFNTFLESFHKDYFITHMPLCMKNPGGSIWIRKL